MLGYWDFGVANLKQKWNTGHFAAERRGDDVDVFPGNFSDHYSRPGQGEACFPVEHRMCAHAKDRDYQKNFVSYFRFASRPEFLMIYVLFLLLFAVLLLTQ